MKNYQRSHKSFFNNDFRSQLQHDLNKGVIKISDLDHFNATVLKVLDNEASARIKYARANVAFFMSRAIKKANIKRFLTNPINETFFIKSR